MVDAVSAHPEEDSASPTSRAVGRRNFQVVWAANFVTAIGMMAFIPLFPLYLRELGVEGEGPERVWSGVMAAGAPLMAAFMGPLWGSLGDRVGRKPMLMRANLAIVLFVGSMGLVSTVWQLLALRLAQGLFSGFIAPAMTLVSVSAPPEQQGRTMGWLQTGVLCGSAVGPLVGGAVADAFGLRAVFLVCASLNVVALVLVGLFVVEPERSRPKGGELKGPGALVQAVLRDLRVLLASRALRGVLIGVFAVRFGASVVEPVLALFVETLKGVDPAHLATDAGLVFSAQVAATVFVTPLWGRLGDSRGPRRVFRLCAAGAALSYAAQAWVTTLPALMVLRFISGAFLAGIMPTAYSAASRHSSTDARGGAYGFTFSSVILARGLGLLAGGWLAAHVGLAPLFVIGGVLMGVAAVMARMGTGEPAATPRSP
jgi:DHA1 family multidrug resistance protein-like MFS transporter